MVDVLFGSGYVGCVHEDNRNRQPKTMAQDTKIKTARIDKHAEEKKEMVYLALFSVSFITVCLVMRWMLN